MAKGLYSVSTKGFYELTATLLIGSGKDCDISLEGNLAPHQVQIFILENETFIKNLDVKLQVSVNKKILSAKFFFFLLNLSLVEVGNIKFIYSEEGAPRPFQIKKVLEDFDMVDSTDFDKSLLEKASKLDKEIDELSKTAKPVITEMEKIKNEIAQAIKDRDKKAHEYHVLIQEGKNKFEKIKAENSKIFEELTKKKAEIKKVLKEASVAKPSTKLELEK